MIRINLDGSEQETVFVYIFIDESKTVLNWAPYCRIGFSFVKDGILIDLFMGDKDTQYYLTNPDGSNARFLGNVSGTSSRWLGDLSLVGKIDENLDIHMNLNSTKGRIEGSYYYGKYGQKIKLSGYYNRGYLELYEEGSTGRMYGIVIDDMIKGVWTDDEKVLPMAIFIEGWVQHNIYKPDKELLKFEGFYEGKNANDNWGSNIKSVPIFDDLAYIETFAYANAVQNVHTGGFRGLALFDNGGLNYQTNEKIYVDNETIVFRLTTGENGDITLHTNDFGYNCGAGVNYDFIYAKK